MFTNSTYLYVKEITLRQLIENGEFTIPKIAELSNLSTTTVAKMIASLKEEIKIREVSMENNGSKGRRAVVYGMDSSTHYFLGVDIKNNHMEAGVTDFSGKLIHRKSCPDFKFENTYECFDQACENVDRFLKSLDPAEKSKIEGICFNLGGRVNSKLGTSSTIFNFEEMQDTPLADILSERFGLPVMIENDTKAMAYADYTAYGKAWPNTIYCNIGWHLGVCIFIDGKIYYGRDGYTGEMGHISKYENNIMCHCGKKGCIETEVSGMAIVRKLTERVNKGETSILSAQIRKGEKITTDDIIEATEKEDPLCIELVSKTATELGKAVAAMVNLLNPHCIIIGGKLSKASSFYFLEYVQLMMRRNSLKLMTKGIKVLPSKYQDDAGIIGACLLIRDRLYLTRSDC